MNARFPLLVLAGALLIPKSHGETAKDREGAVRKDRAALEYDARWIYHDFRAGFAKAKHTGRPLLVVIRCVPCLACAGIDAQVIEEKTLGSLLDQFVRGRVINASALEELNDEDRAKLGIAKDRMALRAKGVGQFGKHAAAKNAGFLKDDILTELDGSSAQITESGLPGKLLKAHQPGERVKTAVLRGGSRLELSLPMP